MTSRLTGWNYRVMRTVVDDEVMYGIHEVYYNEKDQPESWTQDPVSPLVDSEEELKDVLRLMSEALDKPVLDKKGTNIIDV